MIHREVDHVGGGALPKSGFHEGEKKERLAQ
jgi:hypothetical protein